MEGVEGELVASALTMGICCVTGIWSNEVNSCNPKLATSSPHNVCLWVCGVDIEGDLVAEFCV
eukprot:837711-Pelagomonas_calceolata.AAC.1